MKGPFFVDLVKLTSWSFTERFCPWTTLAQDLVLLVAIPFFLIKALFKLRLLCALTALINFSIPKSEIELIKKGVIPKLIYSSYPDIADMV